MPRASLDLEQLERLPDDRRVALLRERPEDQWFDRKSSRTEPRALGELMAGFANADGGLIAMGLHKGTVEGVARAGTRVMNEWRQAAVNFTDPPVRHRFELVPCVNDDGTDDHLALIEVEVGEQVHRTARGETFLRVGDENRKLALREARELGFDRGQSVFDGEPVQNARRGDLAEPAIAEYMQHLGPRSDRADEALDARGLLVARRGVSRPTVAGVLLLGREPQRFYPEAVVRVLRYRGSSRETGSRSNVDRDLRFDGTLAAQIEGARRRVARLLPATIRLGGTGRFQASSVIPQAAWLEAIVNAVVHRSYSLGGDHIRVELFDDRLEVESPGRLPGLVRVETIRSTRFARNPRIARAMADLGYGRELGEGVNRMFEEMERAGFPAPLYTEGPASVQVTFLFESVFGRILERLPTGSERFVEYFSRTRRVTTTEANDLLGMSRPTTLGWLRQLVDAGLLQHVGTSPKDPRGFWQATFEPAERPGRRSRPRARS